MEAIDPESGPDGIDPYSPGIIHDDFIFVSGQIPIDPKSNEIIQGGIREQTKQVLENISTILNHVDSSLDDVIKVTVVYTDVDEYNVIHDVYKNYLKEPYPSKTAINVPTFRNDIGIEIDAIAIKGNSK